ncbi:hypothetical protein FXO38_27294 [Capsicum annuum]|uniref:RING-type E3 ubiquitin transferase n=1 Tax=Capsicum annuum TaxID=4072 RepID=A0A2G3AHZ1_CAPAN|nr:hypothetical protein FXO37_31980 [Capsicum annuum]KAF3630199.1 hypothetical protein FXO38_27294 [Capsicum annuum]PHT93783.1 hypothetical protein T459_01665 [Capsicum annuum]
MWGVLRCQGAPYWLRKCDIVSLYGLDNSELMTRLLDFQPNFLRDVMEDSHIAADGYTYEGNTIKRWLYSGDNTSPMTNLKLDTCDLIPNYDLYYTIQEWQQQS